MSQKTIDLKPLKIWFRAHKRDLPWRNAPSSYQVWVSEVMLQQTQVKVVIPYYERWMKRFPNISSLASASLDEVIKLWEGLGYYSRARNLHEGARQVLEHFNGEIPHNFHDLARIKGLGPYTIGAILSFAFHQKIPAVDGNTQRVIARLYHLTDDFSKSAASKKVWDLAETLLPEEEPWIINEALIELGATVCTRKPQCSVCPLRKSCQSYSQGDAASIPFKSRKTPVENLYRIVTVVHCQGKLLIQRGEKGNVMSDLHEFPYFPCGSEGAAPEEVLAHLDFRTQIIQSLPIVSHGFTRYQTTLYPFYLEAHTCSSVSNSQWIEIETLKSLAFSSGHRRILDHFLTQILEKKNRKSEAESCKR